MGTLRREGGGVHGVPLLSGLSRVHSNGGLCRERVCFYLGHFSAG